MVPSIRDDAAAAPSASSLPEPAVSPSTRAVLERIAGFAVRLLDAPVGIVALRDGTRAFAGDGDAWRARLDAPVADTLCHLAMRSGRPLAIDDARTDALVAEHPLLWMGETAYLGVPVRGPQGDVAGCLSCVHDRPHAWTEAQVETLVHLAGFASAALAAGAGERARESARGRGRRVSARMLEKAVETMQLGVTITDVAGRIIYTNAAEARMHGYGMDELPGMHARVFAPAEHARPIGADAMAGVTSWSRETTNVRKDGSVFPVVLRSDVVTDRRGRTVGIVTCCEDVSQRRQLERQLLRSAFYDPLTGLPNRVLLTHRLERAVEAARRGGASFAVLAVGMDAFKRVCDSLGPQAGDELVAAAAARVQTVVRADAMLARLGADELAVLLDDADGVVEATRLAERVQEAVAAPFEVGGVEVFSAASVGIAHSSTRYAHAEEAVRDAVIAMYRSRDAGKGQYEVFDHAMHAQALARLRMETDLRRAVERGELRVHYQPIVMLQTGRIAGFEALVRWMHPELGLVLPDDFIPLAEETGLIVPIGLWVLREACLQLTRLQTGVCRDQDVTVAVNLSVKQVAQPDLVERVAEVLAETGIDPRRLKLEITESVIMHDPEAITGMLHRLKALGIQLHIDDFGTGYSSLHYLHRLPLDALKIDRSFLSEHAGGPNLQLVRAIVAMAHALDVVVVTEGVESAELLEEMRTLRCEYAQGFFFSRPLDEHDIERLCVRNPVW
ncbi:MAG: Ammonium transporter, Amt family [Gemmatimonadetes bacterium]|nr:Ammonium transporter, Amt family [Gemmatimonadota bacterium]